MNREALEALREKVEAGVPCGSWDAAMTDFAGAKWNEVYGAFNGSLDAAKALHEALLPGWGWALDTLSLSASVYEPDYPGIDLEARCYSAESADPARAWLLAILSALLAEGGE